MLDLNPGALEVTVKIQTILQGLRLLRQRTVVSVLWRCYAQKR